jgi:TetR/AcrR family transcriptional repressor of nem operon
VGFEILAGLHRGRRKQEARALAIVTFSALVGAVTFARLVTDEALSQEILRTVRKAVKSWADEG